MGDYFLTPKARISFVNLHEPRASKPGATPKYSVTLLFDKKTTDMSALVAAVKAEAAAKFPGANVRMPIKDGDKPNGMGNIPEGFAGNWVIEVKTNNKPGVFDEKVQPVLNIREKFYPGCYVIAQINFYDYSTDGNRGIAGGLSNIQFVGHGEKITGGNGAPDAKTVFAPVAVPGSQAASGNGKAGGDSLDDLLS